MGVWRRWASNLVFGPGHGSQTGATAKTDPGATIAADGIVPGEKVGAQHINYILDQATRYDDQPALAPVAQDSVLSVSSVLAIDYFDAELGQGGYFVGVCGINGRVFTDADLKEQGGFTTASSHNFTTLAAKTDDGSIVVGLTGASGNGAQVSTAGRAPSFASVTTDLTLTGTPEDILYDPVADEFLVTYNSNANLSRSTDGDTWSNVTAFSANVQSPATAMGYVYVQRGAAGSGDFVRNTTSGVNTAWSTMPAIPSAATEANIGRLGGTSQALIYATEFATDEVRIYRATTIGLTDWTLVKTVDLSSGTISVSDVKVLQDTYADLVHVVIGQNVVTERIILTSFDHGLNWTNPYRVTASGGQAIQAAGGFLWLKTDGTNGNILRSVRRLAKA